MKGGGRLRSFLNQEGKKGGGGKGGRPGLRFRTEKKKEKGGARKKKWERGGSWIAWFYSPSRERIKGEREGMDAYNRFFTIRKMGGGENKNRKGGDGGEKGANLNCLEEKKGEGGRKKKEEPAHERFNKRRRRRKKREGKPMWTPV